MLLFPLLLLESVLTLEGLGGAPDNAAGEGVGTGLLGIVTLVGVCAGGAVAVVTVGASTGGASDGIGV